MLHELRKITNYAKSFEKLSGRVDNVWRHGHKVQPPACLRSKLPLYDRVVAVSICDRVFTPARPEGRLPSTQCSCTPISRPSFWASSTIVAGLSWRRKRRCIYHRQLACSHAYVPHVYAPRPSMSVVQYVSIYTQCLQVEHWCSAVTTSTQSLTSIDISRRRSLVCAQCWYMTAVIYVRITKLRNVGVPTSYCRRRHPRRSSFGEQAMFQWPSLYARPEVQHWQLGTVSRLTV